MNNKLTRIIPALAFCAVLGWLCLPAQAQQLIRDIKGTGGTPPSEVNKAQAKGRELVKTGQFYFPRLQFECKEDVADKWWVHPIGDQKLREAIKKLSNINILPEPVVVNLDDAEGMSQYPFVFMTSEGEFVLPDKHVQTLREYLLRGGFLYGDDCVIGQNEDHFYESFIREMKRVFPDNPMVDIPKSHELFHCVFPMPEGAPFMQGNRKYAGKCMGLLEKDTGRLMAVVSPGDVHCGWVGFDTFPREGCSKALQFGVNVVVYALSH